MGSEAALQGTYGMDAASHELPQSHEQVSGEKEEESVVGSNRREGLPVVHERAGLPLKSAVEGGHCGVVSERGEVRKQAGVEH